MITARVYRNPKLTGLGAGARGLLCLLAVLIVATPCRIAVANPTKSERQSSVKMGPDKNGPRLSSSALIKLLNIKLKGAYEDLELVFKVCYSGEMARRAARETTDGGLRGEWSVSTAADRHHVSENEVTNDRIFEDKEGLPYNGVYYHGYAAQYIKELKAKGNTVGNKALHEKAKAENAFEQNPQYASSGAAADNMTVHGGTKSC